jgi:polyhydroxyalkanoate synthesis regulator phasin
MRTNTKIKLGAIVAVAIAVAGGGVALAASEPWDQKEEAQAVIDDAAQQLGVEPNELSDALKQALKNRVDDAVAAGRLTEEQATKLKAAIDANDVPLPLGLFGSKGFGPHLDHPGHFGSLSAASDYLGVSEAEIRSRLDDGKTLAQIAKDEGKSVDGLVQALLDDAGQKLEDAVEAGKLTQAEANRIRADWKERITDFVNGDAPFGLHFGFGKEGFGFREQFEYRSDGFGRSPWLQPGPSA